MQQPFTLLFYGKLFELDPAAAKLFHHDVAHQGRKLMSSFDGLARLLHDVDAIQPTLRELGKKHRGYGVRDQQYETFVTALIWSLAHALGSDFDMPTRSAWRSFLTLAKDAMRQETGLRERPSASSTAYFDGK